MKTGAFFDDFTVGDRWKTAGYTFTEAAIVDYAFQFDPQPFHLDVEAARGSIYGGLIASGFHTLSVCFRLVQQTGVLTPNNIGGKGLDALRWLRPVRPGDTVHVEVEALAVEESSKPDRGNLSLKYSGINQDGETVLTAVLFHVVRRRAS